MLASAGHFPVPLGRKSKLLQNPSSALLHYCWRNSSFRDVFRYMSTIRYWYCAVFWGIRFAEFGVEFCEKIRQNLRIDHPSRNFRFDLMHPIRSWWSPISISGIGSRINPLVSSQHEQHAEYITDRMLVNWRNIWYLLPGVLCKLLIVRCEQSLSYPYYGLWTHVFNDYKSSQQNSAIERTLKQCLITAEDHHVKTDQIIEPCSAIRSQLDWICESCVYDRVFLLRIFFMEIHRDLLWVPDLFHFLYQNLSLPLPFLFDWYLIPSIKMTDLLAFVGDVVDGYAARYFKQCKQIVLSSAGYSLPSWSSTFY